MFLDTPQTTAARLPTRAAIATLVILAVAVGASAPAAAQTTVTIDDGNSTAEADDETETILYQFSGGEEVVDIEFVDRTAHVTLRAATDSASSRFAVAEGGLKESGGFAYRTVRIPAGETRTVELPSRFNAVVVTTTDDGYYHTEASLPTIVQSTPTAELLQMSAISGVIGTVLAMAIVIGQLKRRHENTYRELFSEERVKIESDPVEGAWGWLKRAAKNTASSRYRIAAVVVLAGYTTAAIAGLVVTPGEVWESMSDGQRLISAGSIASTGLAVFPVYVLIKRIWNPTREFVLDLDSRDVYKAANGDRSGGVAAYSAPPSRIAELEVEGSITTMSTPGGSCHLVRGMDPEANTAEGNPPEIADDREVSIEVAKIDHNRNILTDLATIGRDLIGAMTAFRVTADASAMRDIDAGLRDTVSAGSDSLEDVLADAVAGTRYEGTYQPDQETIDELEETIDTDSDTTMNDTDDITDDGGSSDD